MSQAGLPEGIVAQQAVRRQRLGVASLASAVAALLALLVAELGFVAPEAAARFALLTAACVALFQWLLRSNLNLRLRDPGMTVPILVAAGLAISTIVYEAHSSRPAFLALYLMAFMFGTHELELRRLALVALFYVACYGAVIALLHWLRPEIGLQRELFRLAIFTLLFAWFTVHGGYLGRLRAELAAARRRLAAELETAQSLAFHDALTGCYNRRYAMAQLERETRGAARGIPFTLALLDLDHFKSVNDTFGHAAGDEVLKAASAAVGGALRGTDLLARFGGEEFLAIFAGATAQSAGPVAERLRERVAGVRVAALPEGRGITVSIGVAQYHPGTSIEETLGRADRALYRAKAGGRNRVVVDG